MRCGVGFREVELSVYDPGSSCQVDHGPPPKLCSYQGCLIYLTFFFQVFFFFKLFIYLFIYLWLCWVFVSV